MVLSAVVKETLILLGNIIQLARKDAKMSMQNLALRVGVDRRTIARLEKGDPTVSLGILLMVIWILDIPLLHGVDIGRRQSRKQIALLLNALSEGQVKRKPRRNLDDHF